MLAHKSMRAIWIMCGILSLGTGIVGIFLPVLPTTPFVILAAFCFSRGSERLHVWLRNHPRFGKSVRDWEDQGVIPVRAKALATIMVIIGVGYPIVFVNVAIPVKIFVGLLGSGGLAFVLSRPSIGRLK